MHLFKPRYRLPDGSYQEARFYAVEWRQDGKRHVKSLKTANKDAAKARANKLISASHDKGWDVLRPQLPGARKTTIEDFLTIFLQFNQGRPNPLGVRTLRHYTGALRRIARLVKITHIEDIAGHVPELLAHHELASMGTQSRASLMRQASSLFSSSALTHYTTLGLQFENPFRGAVPRSRPPTPFQPLPLGEIKNLLAKAQKTLTKKNPSAYACILLALCGGLRALETAWARWEHVSDMGILVANTDAHETKSRRPRFTPLPPAIVAELRSLPRRGPFILADPSRPSRAAAYSRAEPVLHFVAEWLHKAGISDLKPLHFLRKQYGSLITQSHGLFAAQQMLGHSTPTITAHYYAGLLEKPTVNLLAEAELMPTAIKGTLRARSGDSESAR